MTRADALAGPAAALALSAAATGACCWLLGPTLGLAFAGFALVSVVSPVHATVSRVCLFGERASRCNDGNRSAKPQAAACGFAGQKPTGSRYTDALTGTATQLALVLPILDGWTWAMTQDGWSGTALFWLALLLVTYTAMISTAAKSLSTAVPASLASGIVTTAALAWLAWPIWTAPWMTEGWAGRLITIHPLFAANAVTGISPWPQHDVIYGLTRLGQDIGYAMPSSAWPAIALNVGVALLGWIIGVAFHRMRLARRI